MKLLLVRLRRKYDDSIRQNLRKIGRGRLIELAHSLCDAVFIHQVRLQGSYLKDFGSTLQT